MVQFMELVRPRPPEVGLYSHQRLSMEGQPFLIYPVMKYNTYIYIYIIDISNYTHIGNSQVEREKRTNQIVW